ncbi:MAG TPA: RNA-binding protein [Planctomycetota bacterium]|jgi:RNA recognition motif-containing protein|nr:RNA-binding protein [Planctomycetota bacterium]
MTKKLYVGNLSYTTTEDSLRTLFGQHGQVKSCAVVTDRETGRSRGFGFVEMDDASADKAVAALNGADFENRRLVVNEARSQGPAMRGGGGGGGGGSRYG